MSIRIMLQSLHKSPLYDDVCMSEHNETALTLFKVNKKITESRNEGHPTQD